jgi:hypothetical protein
MSGGGAHVGSIDAVRYFRAVLHTFAHDAREALISFDTEVARTLDWLLEEMPQYWKNEIRRCEEKLQEARIDLERCRNTPLPGGGTPSCMEQKKALEKAKAKLQYSQDKLEATRRWGAVASREASEYTGRSNQLGSVFDAELPQAVLVLDRVLRSLEAYQSLRAPTGDSGAPAGAAVGTAGTQSTARPEPVVAAAGGEKAAEGAGGAANPQATAAAAEHTKQNITENGGPSAGPGSSQS